MATYYSKNPTDWYALEGIYIAEMQQPGGASIRSSAGIAKLVGEFPWGPVGELVKIGASSKFKEALIGESETPEEYRGFRAITGKSWGALHIVRVGASGQAKASATLSDSAPKDAYKLDAKYVGAAGNEIKYIHTDQGGGTFDLTISWGSASKSYRGLSLSAASLEGVDNPWVDITLIDDTADVPADSTGFLTGGANGSPDDADYEDALDVMLAGGSGGVVFAAEYTSPAWLAALQSYVAEKRAVGVAQAAGGDVAANITAARAINDDRMILAVHRVKQFIESQLIEVDLTPFIASVLVNSSPHISPAANRNREWLKPIRAFADGVALTRSDYIEIKQAGGMALEQEDGDWTIVSGITSDTTPGHEQVNTRRMKDLIAQNAARALGPFQSEPPYPSNVNGAKAALVKTLHLLAGNSSNPDSQMIERHRVDVVEVTPNSVQFKLAVKLWGAMDHLIASILVGENVVVSEE